MYKIKDRIFLGIVASLFGSIPGRVLNKIEFKFGFTDSRYEQMAATLFVSKKDAHKPIGKVIGKISNGLLANAVGIATTFTLSATGRDYSIIKGIGITSTVWQIIYGMSTQKKMRKSRKPLAALLSYIDHVIFGATTAILITKLGDDSLFPDRRQETSLDCNATSK